MQLEAGQLFRDIAVAISVSLLLSLVVAVTVIPALSSRLLRGGEHASLMLPVIDHLGMAFKWLVMGYTKLTVRFRALGILMVAVIGGGAAIGAAAFLPRLEYLPEGNRNLVFGILIPPPGYNLNTTETIAQRIENTAQRLWERPLIRRWRTAHQRSSISSSSLHPATALSAPRPWTVDGRVS